MCVRSDSGEFFRLIIMESEVIMKGLSLKRAGAVGLMLLSAVFAAAGCGKDGDTAKGGDGKTKVVLNEVAHSIFYAPMYVAIEEGYFEDAGMELTLVTGFGADNTMSAVLTGEADIGFMGCESTVYTYAGGTEDYVVNFAQLTQRAGNFLVSREPIEDFSWKMLVGKNVLGGRAGGMPEMVFEYILTKNGIDPKTEVDIDQSIDFGSTAAAFSGGQGDFTVEWCRLLHHSFCLLAELEPAHLAGLGIHLDGGYDLLPVGLLVAGIQSIVYFLPPFCESVRKGLIDSERGVYVGSRAAFLQLLGEQGVLLVIVRLLYPPLLVHAVQPVQLGTDPG